MLIEKGKRDMAIDAVVEEGVQTKLVEESTEERQARAVKMMSDINKRKTERQRHMGAANALKAEVKKEESKLADLLNLINSGQGTIVEVAISSDSEPEASDDETVSDDELAQFMDEATEPASEATAEPVAEEPTSDDTSEDEDESIDSEPEASDDEGAA